MVCDRSHRQGMRAFDHKLEEFWMNAAVEKEIRSLRELKIRDLKARYRQLFAEDSPSCNRVHLFRRIAWRLQALAEGDLSQRARESERSSLRLIRTSGCGRRIVFA